LSTIHTRSCALQSLESRPPWLTHASLHPDVFYFVNRPRANLFCRATPAMAAGVTKRLTEIHDVVDVFEAWAALGA